MQSLIRFIFHTGVDYEKRVFGLDVFRAVAIILVVLTHGNYMIAQALPGFPYIQILDGVELFFVLSGFLIGTIIIKMYEKEERFGFREVFWFLKRRWFRTLPNYYLILIANILLAWLVFDTIDNLNWKFFFFLQNFSSPFIGFFWESWSLTIEEWFYLILPFVIMLLTWLFRNQLSKKQIILIVALLFIAIPTIYRVQQAGVHRVDFFWWDVRFRKLVLTRLDTIMFGVFGAYIKYYHKKIWTSHKWLYFIVGMAMIYYTLYFLKGDPNEFFRKTFYFSVTSFGVLLLLPLADSIKQNRSRFGKVITHISLISYSMYLVNLGLVSDVIRKYFMPETPLEGVITYIIYWIVVIVVSSLIYKYFEKPMMDLRDRNDWRFWKK